MTHQRQRILDDMIGDRNLANELLQFDESVLAVQHRTNLIVHDGRCSAGNLELFIEARIGHEHLEHEPVLLRFGQTGRCLLVRWGFALPSTKNGVAERVTNSTHGDLTLLHRFEQRGLGLGRGSIDFVGQHHVGEEWALQELELALASACGFPR